MSAKSPRKKRLINGKNDVILQCVAHTIDEDNKVRCAVKFPTHTMLDLTFNISWKNMLSPKLGSVPDRWY